MSDAQRLVDAIHDAPTLLDGGVEIVDHPTEDFPCLELKRGRFEGAMFAYGRVKFVEDDDGGLRLQFDYELVQDANGAAGEKKDEFIHYVGDLLTYLILCSDGSLEDSEWATYEID